MNQESSLASFVANTKYSDIPQDVVELAKWNILDTMGTALAGSAAPAVKDVVEILSTTGKGGRCSTFVFGDKLSPQNAAMVNTTMSHALDFDDDYEPGTQHIGVNVMPSAFAISQYLGGISGKDFLTAYVLGAETTCRMTAASRVLTKPSIGWMFTPLYGGFAAAATAARLLGMNEDGILNAWGIAYAQAAGNVACVSTAALVKRIQPGFASGAGILAALMASKGITGAKASMTGQFGILNVYQRGDCDPDMLSAGLGKEYQYRKLSFKPYPCGRPLHSPIDAALELILKNPIKPDQIDEVTVEITARSHSLNCVPVEIKHNPPTIVDAQFSIPYVVASALAKKKVDIDTFTEPAIRDADTLRITGRLRSSPIFDVVLPTPERPIPTRPARVVVKANGKTYAARVDYAKGHPQNPMSKAELENKFRYCASRSIKRLTPEAIEQIIRDVQHLEEVKNVNKLLRLMVPAAG